MKKSTQTILEILKVIAWIFFIGSIIKAIYLFICLCWPFTLNLIPDKIAIDPMLPGIWNQNKYHYLQFASLLLFNAWLFVSLTRYTKNILTEVNLTAPFSKTTVHLIEKIAYTMIFIFVFGYISDLYARQLSKTYPSLDLNLGQDTMFVFYAGIIYIISQVFKLGLELQEEQKLTI